MKSYITRKFKKFTKNANGKGFDKDRRKSSSSQFKSQDKGKKDARDGGQYTVPARPNSIGKSKAFAATLSNTEPKDDFENKDDRILNAFTATANPTEGIVKNVDEKKNWWILSLRRWMIKMISIQPRRNYTSFLRNMRNSIG